MIKSESKIGNMTLLDNTEMNGKISVFRVFSVGDFMSWESWNRLESILKSNGGAYGITGPRGSGKSWLILRGVRWATENKGVGLWFPTPSDYGAEPFLVALADNLAKEVQHSFPRGAPKWYDRFTSTIWPALVSFFVFVWFLSSIYLSANVNSISEHPFLSENFLSLEISLQIRIYLTICMLVFSLLMFFGFTTTSRYRLDKHIYTKAIQLRQRLRYTETQRKSSESFAKLSKTILAGFSSKREIALTERTTTIASLVYELRSFMRDIVDLHNHPIVIGIDELDKIHDAGEARRLLRDVKGIFEVEGVHFLVSVSDEARRNLELGTLHGKDEFNSSFYTVIEVLPCRPNECVKLLEKRSPNIFEEDAALTLSILSAGNLRELVRLADIVGHVYEKGTLISEKNAAIKVLSYEADAFRQDIFQSQLSNKIKVWVYKSFLEWKTDDIRFQDFYDMYLVGNWNLTKDIEEASEIKLWNDEYAEAWRRLIIRTAISMIIRGDTLDLSQYAASFQNIILNASHSADVSKMLFQQMAQPAKLITL